MYSQVCLYSFLEEKNTALWWSAVDGNWYELDWAEIPPEVSLGQLELTW